MNVGTCLRAFVALALILGGTESWAQNVKITPLGSHTGELCDRDRATIFEDPSGVRILYDAGQSVTGADDARLGAVHVVLLSHAHGDHIGDRKMAKLNAGTCDKPETVSAAPSSTTAEIAAAKNAAVVMVADMGAFIGRKIEKIRGKPTGGCARASGDITVPSATACLATTQLGGTTTIKATGAARAVEVTIVYASHASGVPASLLTDPEKTNLAADNLILSLGPPTGYVIRFTNGLTVYLSGDTGLHTEMRTLVHDFHKANLVVINLGPNAVTPQAAAYAINELVQPASVIASHPNEGVTNGGKLKPQTRTAKFVNLVKGRPVHLALSGRTMEFDGNAHCVAGCD
ncbi:MAG TPA: MBL fold metallo-hydrolase [Burkholderiales bacterium]|nr:MBL fold metallo-hydrolase [Burkholderiales bacterium]